MRNHAEEQKVANSSMPYFPGAYGNLNGRYQLHTYSFLNSINIEILNFFVCWWSILTDERQVYLVIKHDRLWVETCLKWEANKLYFDQILTTNYVCLTFPTRALVKTGPVSYDKVLTNGRGGFHINGLMQKRRNFIANAMDIHVRLLCIKPWASYQIRKIAGCACAGNAGNVFPATDFKGNR